MSMTNGAKWVCYDQNNLLSCAFVMNPDLIMATLLCQSKAHETWLCQDVQRTVIYVKHFSVAVRILYSWDTSLLQMFFHQTCTLAFHSIYCLVQHGLVLIIWRIHNCHFRGWVIIPLKCEFCLEQVSLACGTQKPSEKVLFCNHIFGETGRNLNT